MREEFTENNIIEWTNRQLGYPTVDVELTNTQLKDCLYNSLDEIAPWVVQPRYVTLPTAQRIDLSDYNVLYVINVHKTDGDSNFAEGNSIDPFAASYQYINMRDVTPFGNSPSLSSTSYMHQFTNTHLEYELSKQVIRGFKDNISFRYIDPYLYLDIGTPLSSHVTIEYSNKILEVKDITDILYQRFVKRFTLCYARAILSDIRGKFTVSGSPVELDASTQDDKGNRELEALRQELKDTLNTQFIRD